MSTSEIDIDLGLRSGEDAEQDVTPAPVGPLPVMAAQRGQYDEVVRLVPQDVEIELDAFGTESEAS